MSADPDLLTENRVLGRAAQENFPVASRLLGRQLAGDLMAVYGFARLVDDTGDESAGDRRRQLDTIDGELDLLATGTPRTPIMARLATTVRRHDIDPDLLRRLVQANRQDQTVHRYGTFADLVAYCRLSADPVGRIVLAILHADSPANVSLSDDVCTALQVIEHLQDVAEDLAAGRVYLPQQDLARFGCSETDLLLRPAPTTVRCLVAYEAARAAALLESGPELVGALTGRGRVAVAGFVAGGQATLTALGRSGYAVADTAPRPSRSHTGLRWIGLTLRGDR